jgi:hypothetical protein
MIDKPEYGYVEKGDYLKSRMPNEQQLQTCLLRYDSERITIG